MFVTVTTFALPQPVTRQEAQRIFESTAPKYQSVAGLLHKRYILGEDGRTAGGIYIWQSKAHAQALYTEEWKDFVRDKYHCEPQIAWFDSPVVVDNERGEIRTD